MQYLLHVAGLCIPNSATYSQRASEAKVGSGFSFPCSSTPAPRAPSKVGAPPGHSLHLCCRPCAGCPGPCAAGPGRIDTMSCPGLSGLASHALRCPPHILTVSVRCLPKHRWLPLVQARCRASCRNGGRFLHRSLQMEIVLLHRWRQLSTGFSFFLLVFFAYARAARLLSDHHAWHGWPLV